MKLAEIKALTTPELQERVVAEEAAYNKKCIDHAVTLADNPAEIRRMRRTIAQMKTILRERELNNN
ncbi:MAG: 50S ribosomal protein L29 [Porphyromonas pasteri]